MPIVVEGAGVTSGTFTLTGRLLMNDAVTPIAFAPLEIIPWIGAMPDPATNTVYDGTVPVLTNVNGMFATTLYAAEDVYYTIRSADKQTNLKPETFAAPTNGATLDLADIMSIIPSPILPDDAADLRAEFAAADSAVATTLRAEFLASALMLTPRQFGTLGIGNDSVVLQSWLDEVVGLGAHGYLEPRDAGYTLADPILATDLSESQYAITGAGPGVSKLIVPALNTVGGIFLDATGTPRDAEVLIRDFSIVTQGVGQGTGFEFTMTPGGNQHQRSITMQNVRIYGEDITEDCFDKGIVLTSTYEPRLDNVIVGGPFGPGVTADLTDGSPQFVPTASLVLDDSYAWHIEGSHFWSAHTAISDIGTDAEGGRLINSTMVGCRVGLDRQRTSTEPSLIISGCHWNARDTGLNIDGGKLIRLIGNHPYCQDTANDYSGTSRDIYLKNTERNIILGNNFQFPGVADRINIHIDGATLGRDSIIDDNVFGSGGANAIVLSTLTSGITVGTGNIFPGTYTKRIVDNSGVNAIFYADGEVWRMENQGAGSVVGPDLQLVRDSLSPAAADFLGGVTFKGKDSADAEANYAAIRSHINDPTNASEDGAISVWVMIAGTLTKVGQYDAPASGQTAWHVLGNRGGVFTLDAVTHGVTDSGGSGFKVLRVPN